MANPFKTKSFSDQVREAVSKLSVGEATPFNMQGITRAKLSGTLSNYTVKGKFSTKVDRDDPGVVWICRKR